jgi:hypothetical protein
MLAASAWAPQPDKRKGRTATVRPLQSSNNVSNAADSKSALRLQRLSTFGLTGQRAVLVASIAWEVVNG